MSGSMKISVRGAVTLGGVGCGCDVGGGCAIALEVDLNSTTNIKRNFSLNSALAFQDLLVGTGLGLSPLVPVKFVYLKVSNGSVDVRLTTPSATDQIFDLSDLWIQNSPLAGNEITALALRGVADIEVLLAG